MYRMTVIAIVLTVVSSSAKLDTSKGKCLHLEVTPIMHCCISLMKQVEEGKTAHKEARTIPNGTDDVKECLKIPHRRTVTCEILNCFGKIYGYVSEDGTVIKEAFEKIFEDDLQGASTFMEAVKESCFKGNISDLDGPPEMCELLKINNCINRQAIYDCTEWDNNERCTGIEDLVKECVKSDS